MSIPPSSTPERSLPVPDADAGLALEAAQALMSPMTELRSPEQLRRARRYQLLTWTVVSSLVVLGLVGGLLALPDHSSTARNRVVYFTVEPRDLRLAVTERGTLESQSNVQVRCEVDDVPGDGITGTTIIWIVQNGKEVEKGDLIVELDTTQHRERVDEQLLEVVYARSQYIARSLDYRNRETQNETVKARAELQLALAKLQLQQYEDEEGGTYQIELQDIELNIQQREAEMLIFAQNLKGTERLFKLGYKSKGDLAQAELQALRTRTSRDRELAQRRELVTYTYRRQKLTLQGAVDSAERNLIQVERNNAAALAQNRVWLKMAETGKVWHEARLKEYEDQLAKCKIYAPQSGMVAYHVDASRWGQSETISLGSAVRFLQPILSIPDMKRMQVQTSVHESVVEQVSLGMPATIRLDAFPDVLYKGRVKNMDVLPDPGGWMASDTKVYKTLVTIDGQVAGVKPGMTAVVEIFIEELPNVLCVPVQSIVRRGDDSWCYVADKRGSTTARHIKLGKSNDRFAEVTGGLEAGERIVVNAAAILDETESQEHMISPDKQTHDATNG